jgi:amino acid transporter
MARANRLGIGAMTIAIAAAALAVFSVFQPAFNAAFAGSEDYYSLEIENNTLLQQGTGWLIVACAIGILGGVCLHRLGGRRATVWAFLVLVGGAVIFGTTVYQVTGYRDVVQSGPNPLLILIVARGSPAVGIHAAQAAGVLAASAGLVLTFLSRGKGQRASLTNKPSRPASNET